ncbi:MAG: hypothetical protein ACKOAZ_11235, partial [Ilumatobacteraceae bacterium]
YGKQRGASIGIIVAGLIALVTLEPRVQRWIDARANGDEAIVAETGAAETGAAETGAAESGAPGTSMPASPADDH